MKPPIFLIGSERSGTNLLRVILDRHPDISGPVPPHLIKHVYNDEPYYGDLDRDDNFSILIEDVLNLLRSHLHSWDIEFREKEIQKAIDQYERSFLSIFKYIYDEQAKISGKNRWFCKANHLYNYAHVLNNFWPDSKFIYLARDPRDYSLSFLNVPGGPATVYNAAKLWKKEQKKCIRLLEDQKLENSVMLIRYEEILLSPEQTISALCKFVGEEFHEEMLVPDKRESSDKSEYWKNLSKGIMQDNMKKYDQLRERELRIIETITRKQMIYLGYMPEFEDSSLPLSTVAKLFYTGWDRIKRRFNRCNMDKTERTARRKKRGASQQVNDRLLV